MSIYTLTSDEQSLFDTLKDLPSTDPLWESLESIASWNDFGGFAGRQHTQETKEKMRSAHLGRVVSEETREKLSVANRGKPRTESQLEALRITNSKPRSPESNTKRSVALKGKTHPTTTCPYCGTTGGRSTMGRWHGINCKAYTQPDRDNP